jgi:3-hydroxyisobutyrate dehydrogenase-like beta-hydroxyacid dehydrogenase
LEIIAVIGLGLMGTPISRRLIQAGYRVMGFDIVREKMIRLAPLGLRPARSAKEAAKGAELILLSLPSWNAVLEAVTGKDGILQESQKGQIIIDTSTSPPWESRALGRRMAIRGIEWMDVPVSGSSVQARSGNLVFMAGGKKSVFFKIKPILDQIGKKTVYVGRMGDAATLKLAINHTLHLNQAAAIEGLVLGLKAGLDPDILFDTMTSGGASSDQLLTRGQDMIAGKFKPKSSVLSVNKDMALSLELGRRLGVMLPLGALYQQFLLNAHHRGWDEQDGTIVMKVYEELADLREKNRRGALRKSKKYAGRT